VRFNHVTRAAATGDRAIVDFTGRIDGIEFAGGQAHDFAITLGEGKMLPVFETALTGMSEGDTRKFSLTFPADYHGKEIAGKNAEFSLTVKSVAAPEYPEVDEEFAKASASPQRQSGELRAEITPISGSSSSTRSRRR
jgi:trigger factor